MIIGQKFGHYVVLDKIGAGGMAEVYRAHDEHLQRDVAVKILPAGFLSDEASRKRFRREALVLSKLSHPNIATVFDFDTQGGMDFLVMELIHGTAISDRIKAGRMQESEIIRLGIQLANGLAAAHARGVIHRDLKPANLMVTPDGLLKILDFGLAVFAQPAGDPDLTCASTEVLGVVAGTVPYMPPEQLRGQPTDGRSDIYALGAVLYEMATGRRPFQQSQSAELIGAILHEQPPPPSAINRQITSGLETVLLKALEKEPARRYQSAREVLAALERADSGLVQASKRRIASVAGAGTVLAVLLFGLTIGLNVGGLRDRVWHRGITAREAIGTSDPGIRARRTVAVLGFKNLSGRPDEAWLSTALSEMLTTELAVGEHLRLIPGENISRMKIDLSLSDADSYGKETLSKIRANLGTDAVVLGSYVRVGDGQIRLDLRLQDAVKGETLAAISERGSETQIDDLVSRTGTTLREKLGLADISPAEVTTVNATIPSNPEAVQFYTIGLAKLRAFEVLAARDLLEKAVAADPQHALAHSSLAMAWSRLGYDEKAKIESKKAFELSANLSRENRLSIEAMYREAIGERERAIEIYRTLWDFFPDNLDYGLQLAADQTAAGKGRDALTSVEALRKLPAPASQDPRIDLAEADAAASLADSGRELAAAEKALAKGTSQGMRLMVARAQLLEADTFRRSGALEKAISFDDSAERSLAAVGDLGGAATALNAAGNIYGQRAQFSSADEALKKALAIRRDLGDQRGIGGSLYDLGYVHYRQADFPAAKTFFEEAIAIRRNIGDRPGLATSLNGLALVLQRTDDPMAKKLYLETLAMWREIGDKEHIAIALNNVGTIFELEPDLAAAKRTHEEAFAIRQAIGNKGGMAASLNNLGDVLFKQGELAEAQKKYEQTLAIRKEIGETGRMALTIVGDAGIGLAAVLIEEGQAVQAEALARQAAQELQIERAALRESQARAVLAQSLLAQGKLPEAQQSIDDAEKLLGKSDDADARFLQLRIAAQVRGARGETAEAIKNLEMIVAELAKTHRVSDQFASRLALGEMEMKSGRRSFGQARLAALEKEATSKGFLLTARKAQAAAKN
jgi:tetratricopeptide (TPR) repeat protein/tRNA A-37 threonylcarbamoyl transferase component Bud32/TolB-like protein